MGQENQQDYKMLVQDLLSKTLSHGAESAEVTCIHGTDLSIDVRNGVIENSNFSDGRTIGIRAFVGQQVAIVSGSDFSTKGLNEMIERVIANAKIIPADPYAKIAPEEQLFKNYQPIQDICDPETPTLDTLTNQALETEAAALSIKGITNSEGAGCSFGRYQIFLATSNNFVGGYTKTLTGLFCSVLGGEGVNMQRDYAYSTNCLFQNLKNPRDIGHEAAHRTLKKLNPVQMKSGNFPVIFDKRVGRSLLSYFSDSISADAIFRGVSFLGNKLGEQIFSPHIHIFDNPHLANGSASVPFDGEGVYNPALQLVENGILKELLTDVVSASKMQIKNNGRASRSTGSKPYPNSTNMYMSAGTLSPQELYQDIDYGFYVTETIGSGLNEITGDFSIGAAGFLIEKGEITIPISEITIASNLIEVFKNLIPANDLVFEFTNNVPTIRVDSFTIAGQ